MDILHSIETINQTFMHAKDARDRNYKAASPMEKMQITIRSRELKSLHLIWLLKLHLFANAKLELARTHGATLVGERTGKRSHETLFRLP